MLMDSIIDVVADVLNFAANLFCIRISDARSQPNLDESCDLDLLSLC